MSVFAAIALVVLAGAVVALLEHTHRRTAQLPRAPFGVDRDSYDRVAYRELRRDLDARRDAGPRRGHYRRAA